MKLFSFFYTGVLFYQLKDKIKYTKKYLFLCIIFLLVSIENNVFMVFAPYTLGYIMFYLASIIKFKKLEKFGDLSYGIYIYAFPVEQVLSSFHYYERGFLKYNILAIIITVLFAFISYHLIEKRFLYLKTKL